MRLRMAVHVGFYLPDEYGITSPDLILLFRLLDAPTLKAHLAGHTEDLALIVSEHLYGIATNYGPIKPGDYRATTVAVKETTAAPAAACIRALRRAPGPVPPSPAMTIPVTPSACPPLATGVTFLALGPPRR